MSDRIRAGAGRRLWPLAAGALIAALAGGTAYAISKDDPGAAYQHSLASQSKAIFGTVSAPV